MIRNLKNMSRTLAAIPDMYPLQLDYFQPGLLIPRAKEFTHLKTMPYAILVQVLEGRYRINCLDSSFDVLPGRVALIPANTQVEFIHCPRKGGLIRTHWVHFRFSYHGLIDFLSLYRTPFCLPTEVSKEIGLIITQSLHLSKEPRESPNTLVAEYVQASRLLEVVCRVSELDSEALESVEKQRFRPLLQYMHDHLHEPLTIAKLAQNAGLSTSRFHSLFLKEFGSSPMRYLKKVRLEFAARLLARDNLKLTHVAELSGFADEFHLSHAFKSYFSMSPKAYRIQAKLGA